MKFLIIIILSSPIFALAAPTVKVTSFLMNEPTENKNSTAELCGIITERGRMHTKAIIISDPGRGEGHYVSNLMPDGSFCHVIRTKTRRAHITTFVGSGDARNIISSKIHSATN